MKPVAKFIGILNPILGFFRHPFEIDNSEQNHGFVFIDKSSQGLFSVRPSFWNLQSGNAAYFLLPSTPRPQVMTLA